LRAGRSLVATKREFLGRFGLTARQFNALAASVRGKITSIHARRPALIKTLERRIERARQVLATMPEGTSAYHQKQRRLAALQQRLTALKEEEAVGTRGAAGRDPVRSVPARPDRTDSGAPGMSQTGAVHGRFSRMTAARRRGGGGVTTRPDTGVEVAGW